MYYLFAATDAKPMYIAQGKTIEELLDVPNQQKAWDVIMNCTTYDPLEVKFEVLMTDLHGYTRHVTNAYLQDDGVRVLGFHTDMPVFNNNGEVYVPEFEEKEYI